MHPLRPEPILPNNAGIVLLETTRYGIVAANPAITATWDDPRTLRLEGNGQVNVAGSFPANLIVAGSLHGRLDEIHGNLVVEREAILTANRITGTLFTRHEAQAHVTRTEEIATAKNRSQIVGTIFAKTVRAYGHARISGSFFAAHAFAWNYGRIAAGIVHGDCVAYNNALIQAESIGGNPYTAARAHVEVLPPPLQTNRLTEFARHVARPS